MRAGAWVLAFVMSLAPVAQVIAGTLADVHCSTHGHSSLGAGPSPHESMHVDRQAEGMHHGAHHATASGGHDHSHCACPCSLVCAPSVALLPATPAVAIAAPERLAAASARLHACAILSVPQRPPASSAMIA